MPEPLMTDADLAALQAMLDALPKPLEPLDVSMLDGFLVGVLLQPRAVPADRWLPHVADVEGRAAPAGRALGALHALVLRRHAELDAAIARRQWFDPWVYQLDDDAMASETVMPWVAGFATAMELFPDLMALSDPALLEPLAMLYAHLDPDDLEDADELLAEIDTLEPPRDLAEAVETLVRSSLLLADVSRPLRSPKPSRPPRRTPRR
jgi:uncharacterized protein